MSYLTLIPATAVTGAGRHLHQEVMSYFPADLPGSPEERRAETNILFAATDAGLIVQSDSEPTRAPESARTRIIDQDEAPKNGDVVRFQVTVNGVRRRRDGGVTPVADMDLWIEQKLASALDEVSVLRHSRSLVSGSGAALQLDELDGQAVVADAEALAKLVRHGVGRAKAYGCGLLLVKTMVEA